MIYKGLKKAMASMLIAAALIMSAGFIGDSASSASNSVASAQGRRWGRSWRGRNDWRTHIRVLDREHRVRYRMNNRVRVVGYYDRYGRFHAYGFTDRFGRFHRY